MIFIYPIINQLSFFLSSVQKWQFPHISSFHLCMFLICLFPSWHSLFPNFFISSSLTKTQNTTNICISVSLFPDHLHDASFPSSFILWPISMEEELLSHKMRGFCKCFSSLKRELPGKSLLLIFPLPKELHGMFFCCTLIKKQQGKNFFVNGLLKTTYCSNSRDNHQWCYSSSYHWWIEKKKEG